MRKKAPPASGKRIHRSHPHILYEKVYGPPISCSNLGMEGQSNGLRVVRAALLIFLIVGFTDRTPIWADARLCSQRIKEPYLLKKISSQLGYSESVLLKVRKYRPELYADWVRAVGSKNKKELEDHQAETLYRGLALEPSDYDPLFKDNRFFARKGENWFARDSSIALNYSRLDAETDGPYHSYQELLDAKIRRYGVVLALQIPRNMIFNEKSFNNLSVLREDLLNESVFIDQVMVTTLKPRTRELDDQWMPYSEFRRKFGNLKALVP